MPPLLGQRCSGPAHRPSHLSAGRVGSGLPCAGCPSLCPGCAVLAVLARQRKRPSRSRTRAQRIASSSSSVLDQSSSLTYPMPELLGVCCLQHNAFLCLGQNDLEHKPSVVSILKAGTCLEQGLRQQHPPCQDRIGEFCSWARAWEAAPVSPSSSSSCPCWHEA